MEPHQQRVVDEAADLLGKIEALGKFLGSAVFAGLPEEEKYRLRTQIGVMATYHRILLDRIEAFEITPS